jgi:hypothetical protein
MIMADTITTVGWHPRLSMRHHYVARARGGAETRGIASLRGTVRFGGRILRVGADLYVGPNMVLGEHIGSPLRMPRPWANGPPSISIGQRPTYWQILLRSPERAAYPSPGQRPGGLSLICRPYRAQDGMVIKPRALPVGWGMPPFQGSAERVLVHSALRYANARWAVGPWAAYPELRYACKGLSILDAFRHQAFYDRHDGGATGGGASMNAGGVGHG